MNPTVKIRTNDSSLSVSVFKVQGVYQKQGVFGKEQGRVPSFSLLASTVCTLCIYAFQLIVFVLFVFKCGEIYVERGDGRVE